LDPLTANGTAKALERDHTPTKTRMLVKVPSCTNAVPLQLGDVKLVVITARSERPTESVNVSEGADDDEVSTDDEEPHKEPANQGPVIGFALAIKGIVVTKHTSWETFVIGRDKHADLALESFVDFDPKLVSRKHAEISFAQGKFNLKGLTKSRLYPVESCCLKARDVFEICGVRIAFNMICADNGTKAHGVNLSASTTTATKPPMSYNYLARDVSDDC